MTIIDFNFVMLLPARASATPRVSVKILRNARDAFMDIFAPLVEGGGYSMATRCKGYNLDAPARGRFYEFDDGQKLGPEDLEIMLGRVKCSLGGKIKDPFSSREHNRIVHSYLSPSFFISGGGAELVGDLDEPHGIYTRYWTEGYRGSIWTISGSLGLAFHFDLDSDRDFESVGEWGPAILSEFVESPMYAAGQKHLMSIGHIADDYYNFDQDEVRQFTDYGLLHVDPKTNIYCGYG